MMSFGSYRQLLILALSMPEVARALGLGDIRVDSRLNEPLSAQIDIIGATPEELSALSATVANPEIFERYRAERPVFLSSATIVVGQDAQGKPVLNIRSTEAFTEPLVNFLIDVRWGKGELVRDYSLLLDPVGFTPPAPAEATAIAYDSVLPIVQLPLADISNLDLAPVIVSPTTPAQPAPGAVPPALITAAQHRVVAHDTLSAIARRAGAVSEADQQRLMIAIFQANREAFAGNINRLHRDAVLIIPSTEEIMAISSADAQREFRTQMTAWRRVGKPVARRQIATPALAATSLPAAQAPTFTDSDLSIALSKMNSLDGRVQILQQALDETNRQLAGAKVRIGIVEQTAGRAAVRSVSPAPVRAQAVSSKAPLSFVAMALALLAGGLIYVFRRFRPTWTQARGLSEAAQSEIKLLVADSGAVWVASPEVTEGAVGSVTQPADHTESVMLAMRADRDDPACSATVEITQPVEIDVDTGKEYGPEAGDEPDTVILENLDHTAANGTSTTLDYDLSNLDAHAQHVEIPSSLHDHVVVVERRKNVVDTLMAAIQRDPSRSDLRMKLLETLYTAAAQNQRAFKEIVRDMARNPDRLSSEEWQRVMAMGREVAADDALFADQTEEDVADCA